MLFLSVPLCFSCQPWIRYILEHKTNLIWVQMLYPDAPAAARFSYSPCSSLANSSINSRCLWVRFLHKSFFQIRICKHYQITKKLVVNHTIHFGAWKCYSNSSFKQENLHRNADIEVHILITKWERVPCLDPWTKQGQWENPPFNGQCKIHSFEKQILSSRNSQNLPSWTQN